MKLVALILSILVLCASGFAFAADQTTRQVQSQLQALGFYYGAVDGEPGPETDAAIRRYQIRNGLSVTGALDEETLFSLRKGGLPSTEQKSKGNPRNVQPDVVESDREFLEEQEPQPQRAGPGSESRGTGTLDRSAPFGYDGQTVDLGAVYANLFAGTPLERASLPTKRRVVARAQVVLRGFQFYAGEIDGIPGEMTTQAILDFQRYEALKMTGRLDELTLRELGIWRYDGRYPPDAFPLEPGRRVYPGYWIR